jgi:SAM-dependent methyltransferase
MTTAAREWEKVGAEDAPSWYLDPIVAEQKRCVHQALIRRWIAGLDVRTAWKTDLFEEANGRDRILFDLLPRSTMTLGSDVALSTVARAREKGWESGIHFCVCDGRASAVRPASLDLVISTSTLDHFESRRELETAMGELAAALRPGGVLVITLDNPSNPLYYLLRWVTGMRKAPFALGKTLSQRQLRRKLIGLGLEVTAEDVLIHNPRLISTLLFLILRRLLGARADRPIGLLLGAFAGLGKLPTRRLTACFIAARAVKPRVSGPAVGAG